MNHVKADLSKIELIPCLYHRTYMTFPDATLQVSIDGVKKEYRIRKRAAKRDNLYHSNGLKCMLVVYDNVVLAYEIIKSDQPATPQNILNLERFKTENWYFDNERFYQLNAAPSRDFISIQEVNVIDPIHLTFSTTVEVVQNDCFVITKDNEILLQTPPVSTTLENNNKKFLLLDTQQDKMYLSLTAILKMCNTVSRLYGGESIERFDIPQYMIRHKTVNLAKLPPYVRDNSSTNLKPFEAISYLLGLIYKEKNAANILILMKNLRSLCAFGITNISNTLHENVYKEKKIEIKKIDFEALKYAKADTVIGEEIENDTAENNLEN